MANIAAFQGLRYHCRKAGPMDSLVGPPYDPVQEEHLDAYRSRSEFNILNLLYCQDSNGNGHQKAAEMLRDWQACGCMARDPEPAIYLYEIEYQMADSETWSVRTGFIALLRVQDYHMGVVRPHERTFTAVKKERLDYLTTCGANVSQIMAFYDDPGLEVAGALGQAAPGAPAEEFTDLDGVRHRLWLVTDPQVHLQVARLMEHKQVYIADGHHRYETALAYRDHMAKRHPRAGRLAPFHYTMAYLSAMQDPGLAILPAHRLINCLPEFDEDGFLDLARKYFEIETFGLSPRSTEDRERFKELLSCRADQDKAIGYLCTESDTLRILTLRPERIRGMQAHPALRDLDVMALREIAFDRCLGLNKEIRAAEGFFSYEASLGKGVEKVLSGQARVGFFLNPTRVAQVKVVADAGLVMPRKSTMFYPKVSTGLALRPISMDEEVADPLYW